MENKVLIGDSLVVLKDIPDNSIDSVVTDPPYEIGFMGKSWDSTGIANNVELWKECLRVLKPGGHLLAFSGTRTYHRMAVAIEDAGFEIRDMIEWVYGSGFPKNLNISKALDKRGGNNHLSSTIATELMKSRESRNISKTRADEMFCGGTTKYSWFEGRKEGAILPDDETFSKICEEWPELSAYRDMVKSANRDIVGKNRGSHWTPAGTEQRTNSDPGDKTIAATEIAKKWEGWGTALKPAHEPICMARKPLTERTVALNVVKWNTGGINIDDSRISIDLNDSNYLSNRDVATIGYGRSSFFGSSAGRNPAFGRHLFNVEQGRWPANLIHDGSDEVKECFPETKSGGNRPGSHSTQTNRKSIFGTNGTYQHRGYATNSGNGSRYFKSIVYNGKASKKDRGDGNDHPTVKPTALMEYLVRMVTPPGGVVLDPFGGSGSTAIGCINAGMRYIIVEQSEEYIDIINRRIEARISNPNMTPAESDFF